MTYQVTMIGADGVVMASDRLQLVSPYARGDVGISLENDFRKIAVDPMGRYAWAFAGDRPSFKAAQFLTEKFNNRAVCADDTEGVLKALQDCCDRGARLRTSAMNNSIIFADGKTKEIRHVVFDDGIATVNSPDRRGICFTGQSSNKASALPALYYSRHMTVSQLARLAAFSVATAGRTDNGVIGGLDVFAYRDSTGKFEELPLAEMEQAAADLDSGIRKLIQGL